MKITETCACGATFETEGPPSQVGTLGNQAAAWRVDHKHAESVGICGAPSPWLVAEQWSLPCDIKAGHAGMHHASWPDGGDSHWSTPIEEPDEQAE